MEHSDTRKTTATVADKPVAPARRSEDGAAPGLRIEAVFCPADVASPFDTVAWELRRATIKAEGGEAVFEQSECEIPVTWSQLATNVVVSKYFYGELGTSERETSVRQLVHRVARTIADWGVEDGYFASSDDGERFYRELAWLCLHQHASFNSPVWFNVGLHHQYGVRGAACNWHWNAATGEVDQPENPYEHPQGSACFIQSVDDTMEDIMELARSEAMLFKFGSGTGTDLSTLRSYREKLSGGGKPSGPLSFMRVYDQIAGVVKSGGKTRRAAKMQSLKVWHPDILEFIECKGNEEKKALLLIDQGYNADEAYSSILFQNANLSVRLSDDFMEAVEADKPWQTHWVTDEVREGPTHRAKELMDRLAKAAWSCGDPGVQYDTTINRWHTCPNSGRINASNPCSEYMFLDNSACNLASINLMKFVGPDGQFDVEAFRHAVDTIIMAQEIIVDNASYPTEKIAANSHKFRPLGLGFANLGALLMSQGLAYDSDCGRDFAAVITAVMCGQAYLTSARISEAGGPFAEYRKNEDSFLEVIRMHREAVNRIDPKHVPASLLAGARECWNAAYDLGRRAGFRNAQVTVIAPTGTIGFMMDCDTTGIEPDLALVKYKKLVGGGVIKIVNNTVPQALIRLGYTPEEVEEIVSHIDSTGTIEGAPHLKEEHLPVFDCSLRPSNGVRFIHHMGHVKMMAAVQPFISGAISKTINMPEESTVEDIMDAYIESWRLGLKAVAIYRDNSKRVQPLTSGAQAKKAAPETAAPAERIVYRPIRRKLPDERQSITHKFSIGGHEGYITVGLYEDGQPGELFITMAKEGSIISGLMDSFATAISFNLQYGVPLKFLVDKFSHVRFEPDGWTGNPQIPYAKSIMDYIFRWLGMKFLGPEYAVTEAGKSSKLRPTEPEPQQSLPFGPVAEDAPLCAECGSLMTRNGSCFKCENCGGTSGCS